MRQLFVFETVDVDGRVGEVACMTSSEADARAMLWAEGYDGALLGAAPLGGVLQLAGSSSAPPADNGGRGDEPAIVVGPAIPEQAVPAPSAEPGDGPGVAAAATRDESYSAAERATGRLESTAALDAVARDYALVSLYMVGLDVASIARAVTVTPRIAAHRIGLHLLGVPDDGVDAANESTMVLEPDAAFDAVDEMYLNGMSVFEISEAIARPTSDVVWALLDAPSRVVAVTRTVLQALRSDLEVLKGAAAAAK